MASAAIYLVPARPSWNMRHTPIDFVVTAAFLGTLLVVELGALPQHFFVAMPLALTALPYWLLPLFADVAAVAWLANQAVRLYRIRSSKVFELRASFSLLSSNMLRGHYIASFAFVALSAGMGALGHSLLALCFGFAGVLLARYLFFVSVVPLNMGLTFVRTRHA